MAQWKGWLDSRRKNSARATGCDSPSTTIPESFPQNMLLIAIDLNEFEVIAKFHQPIENKPLNKSWRGGGGKKKGAPK
jgi:hypothetical protein